MDGCGNADFFETDDGGVLMVSPMGLLKNGEKETNQSICFPAKFTESTCRMEIPDQYQFTDYGMDLYAPQTTLDPEGRRVMEGWIRMPKPAEEGWIGMFCLPRIVERKGNHIYFRMHPNVRAAYSKEITDRTGRRQISAVSLSKEKETGFKRTGRQYILPLRERICYLRHRNLQTDVGLRYWQIRI